MTIFAASQPIGASMFDFTSLIPSANGWSAIIAVAALINSEFHILQWIIARRKIDLSIHERIAITHTVGIPNATMLLILHNEGNRTLKINGVTATFKRDDTIFELYGDLVALKAPQINVVLTPFRFRQKHDWTHEVIFCEKLSRRDNERLRNLKSDIKNDINRQLSSRTEQEKKDDPKVMEADPAKVAIVEKFFEEKFKWEAGDYKMTINVITDTPSANVAKTYRFTIFENESKILKQFSEKYKNGCGVYFFNNNEQPPIQIEVEPV